MCFTLVLRRSKWLTLTKDYCPKRQFSTFVKIEVKVCTNILNKYFFEIVWFKDEFLDIIYDSDLKDELIQEKDNSKLLKDTTETLQSTIKELKHDNAG